MILALETFAGRCLFNSSVSELNENIIRPIGLPAPPPLSYVTSGNILISPESSSFSI